MQTINESEFKLIKRLIYKEAGVHLKDHKQTMVANRLRKRLETYEFDSYKKYYDYLTKHPLGKNELTEFVNCLTTNETFFFRHHEQLENLVTTLIPAIADSKVNRNKKTIRIWSAACSTGEEPYSIAILIREKLPKRLQNHIEIIGSDINREVVKKAHDATYKPYAVQRMPKVYLNKYFDMVKSEEKYQLKNSVKKQVTFYQKNLLQKFSKGNFDIILCRNVLIYFDAESKKEVLSNIYASLNNNGYLITGYAENLLNTHSNLHYIKPTLYQKTG